MIMSDTNELADLNQKLIDAEAKLAEANKLVIELREYFTEFNDEIFQNYKDKMQVCLNQSNKLESGGFESRAYWERAAIWMQAAQCFVEKRDEYQEGMGA
jgi:hypothetical protein